MGRAHSTHGEKRNACRVLVGNHGNEILGSTKYLEVFE
jgi:hypothetical protein